MVASSRTSPEFFRSLPPGQDEDVLLGVEAERGAGEQVPLTFGPATEEITSIPDGNDADRRLAASCRSL
jgi:hypothetical protein